MKDAPENNPCPDCGSTEPCRCGIIEADDYDEFAAWEREYSDPEES